MTTVFEAIILGIVQGVTEWLPISSSGHIVLTEHFLGIPEDITMNLVLHFASLLVIYLIFHKELHTLLIGLIKRDKEQLTQIRYLVLGTIPIVIVGVIFNDLVKSLFTIQTVTIALFATAVLLYISQYPKTKEKSITWKSALLIGLAQAVAILPGISRSGTTIAVALLIGINNKEAGKFSFLLAIPAILGATLFELGNITQSPQTIPLLVGSLVAILTGWLSLKFTLHSISKKYFQHFCWYALALGILLVIFV